MNLARKVAITLAATGLSLGLLGMTAPAQAMDTSWGCGGCISAGR